MGGGARSGMLRGQMAAARDAPREVSAAGPRRGSRGARFAEISSGRARMAPRAPVTVIVPVGMVRPRDRGRRTGARDAPPPNAAPRTSEPRRASTVCRWRLGWRELLTASSRQAAVLVVSTALTNVCSFPDRWRAALFPRGTSSCAPRARTRTLTLAPALIAPPALSTRPLASAPGLERWASTTDTGGASTGRRSSRTLRSRGRTTDAPRPTAPRANTSRGTRTTPRPSRTRARTTTISPRRDEEVRIANVDPRRGPLLVPSPLPHRLARLLLTGGPRPRFRARRRRARLGPAGATARREARAAPPSPSAHPARGRARAETPGPPRRSGRAPRVPTLPPAWKTRPRVPSHTASGPMTRGHPSGTALFYS